MVRVFFAHRIQEHHEENLMTARNLGVVFGRTYRFLLGLLLNGSRDRSHANAFPQSCGRVQRHGWQGADHRMARPERANGLPATAGMALIISHV
jgi:hypothetical protein